MKRLLLISALGISLCTVSFAAEPTGETFAHTCSACHGTYGQLKNEAFVPLAGMNKQEFVASMRAFRDLKRPSSIMSHIAQGYNAEEINRMAEFFAGLESDKGEKK